MPVLKCPGPQLQPYVMGHNDRERRRLAAQAAIINPVTEQLLHRAGLTSGMRIVDFGCGVGDISLIGGRLVGAGGQVPGADIDGEALSIARGRGSRGSRMSTSNRPTFLNFSPRHFPAPLMVGCIARKPSRTY
jgi:SAM-dependent methyltransferase